MLDVRNLWVKYGMAEAVKGVSIHAERGDIISLIGGNGAGKTTILRTISGLIKPASGEIWFMNSRIDTLPAYKIVGLGIAQCPEGRRLFSSMRVMDNLALGAFLRQDKQKITEDLENVFDHFPILKDRGKQIAGSLSGGEQQMLATGRALMARPTLLMMDEPSLGLSPKMVSEIAKIIKDINGTGVSISLVEQNARMALKLSNKAYVMETGRITLEGKSADIAKIEHIKKAYLGGKGIS